MTFEDSLHAVLHAVQVVITLGLIALFWRNYTKIKSRFNLGLVVFAISVLGQIAFSISLNILVHIFSDIIMFIALVIFLSIVRK